jgi:hypothetical protein
VTEYVPAAVANVVSSGFALACPDCGESSVTMYGIMGSGLPLLCGRCYDNWAFAGRPALREQMEAKRDLMFSGVRHLLDRVIWEEGS